jgi:hypothetical protein
MSQPFDITTEVKDLKLRASFSIEGLFESMTPEQKLLVAETLSLDDTIIGHVVEQLCGGLIDPRGDGMWSANWSALKPARDQIVARMDEFVEHRNRDLETFGHTEHHRGVLDGIDAAFEHMFGKRRDWSEAVEARFIAALDSARTK